MEQILNENESKLLDNGMLEILYAAASNQAKKNIDVLFQCYLTFLKLVYYKCQQPHHYYIDHVLDILIKIDRNKCLEILEQHRLEFNFLKGNYHFKVYLPESQACLLM